MLIETHIAIKLNFRKILIYMLKIDVRFYTILAIYINLLYYYRRKISVFRDLCCDYKIRQIFVQSTIERDFNNIKSYLIMQLQHFFTI